MRVFFLNGSGSLYVRAQLPMAELARRGHRCELASRADWSLRPSDWDVIVAGNVALGDEHLGGLRGQRAKLVYDVDDAVDLVEPQNPAYPQVRQHLDRHFAMLRAAHLVAASTPALAAHLRTQAPAETPVVVLPNSVRRESWRERRGRNALA